MSIALRLIVGVGALLLLGGFCIWGKDYVWKWDEEVRRDLKQKKIERTPQWDRNATWIGVIAIGLAVLLVILVVPTLPPTG